VKAANIVIRTNGGSTIGLGHVRRCLSLAHALRQAGADVLFALNEDAHVINLVQSHNFRSSTVSRNHDFDQTLQLIHGWRASAVVSDSYEFDTDYFASLRSGVSLSAVIDDMADRLLPADVVVNAALNASSLIYRALPTTLFLIGPAYTLLRSEFAQGIHNPVRDPVQRVLITTGGTDTMNLTPSLINGVRSCLGSAGIDVVVGPFFGNRAEIQERADADPELIRVHIDPPCMRDLMLQADLAVTAGGQTLYELAATGTPSICFCLQQNQSFNISGFVAQGVTLFAGADDSDLISRLSSSLLRLAENVELRRQMSTRGKALVDGMGAQRVAGAIVARLSARPPS
jgi:UDP-2,4-diacetamido-2,4,6-trideoxy-beta-L-altropyranose hydrolase